MPEYSHHHLFAFAALAAMLACGAGTASGSSVPERSGAGGGRIMVTPENLLSTYSVRPRFPAARWLPDSRHVVFAITAPGEKDSWIERLDVTTGKRERLVRGSDPKPAPDGRSIAFISGGKEDRRLSLYELEGGRVRHLAPFPAGGRASDNEFAWSRDSRRIAYALMPALPAKPEPKPNQSSVLVVGAAGDVPPDSEIWIVDTTGDVPRKVMAAAARIGDLNWYPDGETLLFTSMGSYEYRNGAFTAEVRSLSIPSGTIRTVIKDSGVQFLRPVPAPDGKTIAFNYDPTNVVYPFYYNIATTGAEGGPVRQLTRDINIAAGPLWSPDSRTIYFGCKFAVFSQICSIDEGGKVRRLTNGYRNVSAIAVSPRGDQLVWTSQDMEGRVEIRTASADGKNERAVADFNPEISNLALGDVEEISWKSRDGLRIPGLLIKPLGYQPGKKYKLLVDIHGGPTGGVYLFGNILKTTPLEWQMWAAKGYAVLVPDYRGSTVPGWQPVLQARENQDHNERDMDDIMSGVDHVIAMGIADPDKLAVMGHSAGSILTSWIVTHSGRFKVAVSGEGWVDMYHAYGSGQRVGGNASAEWMYKGKPWEVPENYRKNSASQFVKGVTTPTMFISADYGGDNGVENLYHHEFMYTAWKQQKVDTQLLIYRGEGHVIQRPENQRDMMTRILDWIDSRIE